MGEWEDLQREVVGLLETEDRKDVEFRLGLALSQLGDVAKYVTHDPRLNPNARSHGTPEDEVLAYGQLLAMVFSCAAARGIGLREAIEAGMEHWSQRDWRKADEIPGGENYIAGLAASPGCVEGAAFVDPYQRKLEHSDGKIIVTRHASPNLFDYFGKATGIVTDEGGILCHAAIVAKKYGIPCVVGTSVATQRIRDGQRVRLEVGTERNDGRVYLL